MKCQRGALNSIKADPVLNRAARCMFTTKHAVNSGQILNRFMFSFFSFLSPSHTDMQSLLPWEPQVLAVMTMK